MSQSFCSLQHFLETIKNDMLGRVCNAHMALSDQFSPSHPDCLDLAKLASQAVDFSKTGVAVRYTQIPRIEEYPDFMGKVRPGPLARLWR